MSIELSSSMRGNLASLKQTSDLLSLTQRRMSTGLKVGSAADGAQSFFAALGLDNRAADLSTLLDGIGQSVSNLDQADNAVSAIAKYTSQAEAIAKSAQDALNEADNVAKIEGTVDLSGTATIASLTNISNNDKFTFGGTDAEGNAITFGTATDAEVTVLTATTRDQFVAAINNISDANGDNPFKASINSDGNLVIENTLGGEIKISAGAQNKLDDLFGSGTYTSGTDVAPTASSERLTQLETDYNEALRQIDLLVEEAGYRGTNLLAGDTLETSFKKDGSNKLETVGQDLTSTGLRLTGGADFSSEANIESTLASVGTAIDTVRSFGDSISNTLTIIETRQEFTESTISTLEEGADKLTHANMEEESANLLALQIRQQLGTTALSMVSNMESGILRLF